MLLTQRPNPKPELPLSPIARRLMMEAALAKARLRRQAEEKVRRGDFGQQYQFYGNNATIQTEHYQECVTASPRDCGKTLAWLYNLNQIAWHYPGCQLAIIRKEYSSMPGTVLLTYQKKIVKESDGIQFYGGDKHPSQYIYPNGSVIWIGGLDKASKVLSGERDGIYVNQTEELQLTDWEHLLGNCSGRAGNMPFHFLGGDCNPGPPTHWIKTRARIGHLKLLNVTHRDNPEIYDPVTGEITPGGMDRLEVLRRLTGANLQRLFYGLWVAPEGAIFEAFDEKLHKVESFPIPRLWPRVVGIDPFGAHISAIWLAYDASNKMLHVYREYCEPFGLTTPQHIENILQLSGYDKQGHPMGMAAAEPIQYWIGGGPSERQARIDWDYWGIPLLQPPISDVWATIDRVIQLLRENRLLIHDCCEGLLSQIGSYQRKIVNGEPTEDILNKETFDLIDALRYPIAWLTQPEEQVTVEQFQMNRIGDY